MKVIEGDMLQIPRGLLLHGCNTEGVMGGGIALHIKRTFPDAYNVYRNQWKLKGLRLGDVIPVDINMDGELWIVNGITQRLEADPETKIPLSYVALQSVLEKTILLAKALDLPVYYPLIGCGLAGGDWENMVSPMIERMFANSGVEHTLCVLPGTTVPGIETGES